MTNYTNSELLAYELLTTNTGSHMLDSGGAYGRHHERNTSRTIEDFKNLPSATLGIYGKDDLIPTVEVFHVLAAFQLDELCKEYNALDCNDWDGDYYGVSTYQMKWLESNGFTPKGDGWNTYNWDTNFSQVLQGQSLYHEPTNQYYQLVQVHGGCDVRGGYTDAKLYYVGNYEENCTYMLDDHCGFSVEDSESEDGYLSLEWSGEWIDREGSSPDDEYIERFIKLAGFVEDNITIEGDYQAPDY